MAKKEWEILKEMLRQPASPHGREAAAKAFRQYERTLPKGSKPTLVSLGLGQGYPNAIPFDQISEELKKNPKFFELMHDIVESD